jgi:hypothetical protein
VEVQAEDVFQTLILGEVILAEGLQGDLKKAEFTSWLSSVTAQPAAKAIDVLVQLKTGIPLPSGLSKSAIIAVFREHRLLYAIRTGRGVFSAVFYGKEHTAHSYCRSALCFAVRGDYVEAEAWLKSAEQKVGDLARPNYIRGLICGAQGQLHDAAMRLKASLNGRAKPETKERIRHALSTAEQFAEQS